MGLLIKYIKPVPLSQSYRKRAFKDFLLFIGLLAAIGALSVLFFGCSLEKRIAKTYRNAEAYNPLTKEDSLHLVRASKKKGIIPERPPKVLPAKTIKVNVPVKTYVLDSVRLKEIEDSLGIANADNLNGLVDDCIASVSKAKSDGIKIGLKEGYNQRNKELKKDSFSIHLPADTLPTDVETLAELKDCELSLSLKQTALTKAETERDIYKKQSKDRFWLILLLAALLAGSVFFNIKRLVKTNVTK